MPGYNPYPGKAAGGKTQKKATAISRQRENSPVGKAMTEVGKQLVYAPLYLVPGGSSVRGASLAVKAARAANISIPKQLGVMARNTGRALNVSKSAGADAVRAGRKTGIPARVTLKKMAGVTARNYGVTRPAVSKTISSGVANSSRNAKIAVGATAGAAGLYYVGRSTGSAGAASRQKYSSMKPGSQNVRTGPKGAYVGSGLGAKPRPKTDGAYVGSTVGGNTGSRQKSSTPANPSAPSNRPQQRKAAGQSKKQIQARRAGIADLLQKAQTAAASGDTAGAANYSAAALARQKAGKGSKASMRRVQNVARTYSKAAGRSKVENRMSARVVQGR